ncbi:phage tail protein, partial [Pseudomonas syringae pv. actinidiae]|nr:phage tail protein [Pseudomonas syringae pv. actinidiae]
TLTGAATEAGLLNLYVGGARVQATVVNGATAAQAATALSVKINATPDLPIKAVVEAGVLTLSCKWSGASGNDIHLEFNRLGKTNGEVIPAGLTAAVTAMTAGVGTPDQLKALAARTAVFISADASRPTQSGTMPGLDPAPASQRFTLTERESLLRYGIATAYYEGGYVRIQRSITTYQKNAYGQADNSYLDSETMHQSAFIIRRL